MSEAQKADEKKKKVVPEGWERTKRKVGDMGLVQGGRQRSPHLTQGAMTPYLRVANVFDGYIDTSDVLEMPFTENEYKRYELKPGDLLLNEGQSLELVGRCAKYEGKPLKCCFQNTLVRFQAGPECETDYAYQLFRWCQYSGVFSLIATKTNSIAHLGSTRFAELELPFPPLPEQRKIASILSEWDDSLSILVKLVEAKRQQKRGLAEQLLTGKRRLPGFQGEWKTAKLTAHSSRNKGKIVPTNKHGDGVPYIGAKSFGGTFEDFTNDSKAVMCLPSDVLILWDGEYAGNSTTGLEGAVSSTVARLRLSNELNAVFLNAHLQKDNEMIRESRTGSGIPHMPSDFEQWYEIPLPPLPEQQAIAAVLSTLDEEISSLEALRASVQEQKRGLMDALLTGRVRVKVEE